MSKKYYKSGYATVESCGDGPYIALRIAAPNTTHKTVYLTDNPLYMRLHIDHLVHDLLNICEEMEGEE